MTYPTAYQLYSSRNFPPLLDQLPVLREIGYDAIEPWAPAYEEDPAAFAQVDATNIDGLVQTMGAVVQVRHAHRSR